MRLGLTSRFAGPGLALLAFVLFSTHDVIVKLLGGSYSPVQIVFFSVLLGLPIAMLLLMRDPHRWQPVAALSRLDGVAHGRGGSDRGQRVLRVFRAAHGADICDLVRNTAADNRAFRCPCWGERVGWRRSAAVLVGLCGVLVVLRPGTAGAELGLGHLAALLGALGGRDCLDHRAQDRRGRAQRRFAVIPNDGQSGRDGSGASLCLPPDAVGRSWRACGHGGAGAGGQLGGDRRI